MVKKNRVLTAGLVVLFLVIAAVSAFAVYLFLTLNSVIVRPSQDPKTTLAPGVPTPTATPTPDPNRDFGVLLLGYGGGNHDGGYLTDTMILAYVQPQKEQVALISLPRDLWVPLQVASDSARYFKMNAAYAIGKDDRKYPNKPVEYTGAGGGGEMAKDVVELVTGLNVENFGALSFQGFKQSIDVLDGVTVKVPQTFEDPWYPIEGKEDDTCGFPEADIATATASLKGEALDHFFTCRYELLKYEKGDTMMNGESALKFVRSRHSTVGGGDFSRSERQRALLTAIRERVFSVSFLPKAIPFISTLKSEFQTDMQIDRMQELMSRADEFRGYTISSFGISTENVLMNSVSADRQFILTAKEGIDQWHGVHAFIQQQLNPEPTPTATPRVTSQPTTTQ
jgi:polyisoprenyl-teichoic acid--peptidoglycan teichoic acid transferase